MIRNSATSTVENSIDRINGDIRTSGRQTVEVAPNDSLDSIIFKYVKGSNDLSNPQKSTLENVIRKDNPKDLGQTDQQLQPTEEISVPRSVSQ